MEDNGEEGPLLLRSSCTGTGYTKHTYVCHIQKLQKADELTHFILLVQTYTGGISISAVYFHIFSHCSYIFERHRPTVRITTF